MKEKALYNIGLLLGIGLGFILMIVPVICIIIGVIVNIFSKSVGTVLIDAGWAQIEAIRNF